MNKLIIYFFISKYNLCNIFFNFITANFIEIIKIFIDFMAAAATVGAFLYTFKSIRDNSVKEKNDQIIKNKKTLYLIDLITEKYREDISEIINNIYEIEYSEKIQVNFDNTEFKYQIIFKDIKPPFPGVETIETEFEDVFTIIETYKYLNDPFIQETIENYIKEIKQNLSSQHQNLDLNSLEKINKKLRTLNELIKTTRLTGGLFCGYKPLLLTSPKRALRRSAKCTTFPATLKRVVLFCLLSSFFPSKRIYVLYHC